MSKYEGGGWIYDALGSNRVSSRRYVRNMVLIIEGENLTSG